MNKHNIPVALHFLISTAEEWGIGDDGYRDEKVENASNAELEGLIEKFTDAVGDELNRWLGNPNPAEPQTEAYYTFSALFMAFEYAQAVLKDRENKG